MSFTQVSLSELMTPHVSESLSFDEWLDFAKNQGGANGKKNCTPGKSYPCKSICLSASKNCRNPLEGQAKNYADWLKSGGEKLEEKKRSPKPGTVADVSVGDLTFDPKRFQYKLVHGESGSSGSLTGVKRWDANLAGVIQVWSDPIDGKTYVVNGHNRANLAKQLGAESVTVRYLDVKDAAEARAVGALTNIAEGRGNALDAAKFFKDSGLTKADLDSKGIPMREKIATDGIALSQLEPALFRRVIDGELPVERATIIGGSGLSHEQQRSLADLIEDQEKKKRKVTNDLIRELTDSVKASESQTEMQMDLFGGSQVVKDNAIERASLQATIKQRLSREKKLFATVGRSKAAQELERAGNVIDIEQSQKISKDAATTLAIFDQLKNMSGPVSSAINQAANRIQSGESTKRVQDELYRQILEDLPKLLGGKSK